ncbi:hypothetical protein MUO32_05080 [Shinella sp. CPCC 101442]|uniref:hypothetical protein n=1 Tax=Shinella sp. CPCC 101442 TaxID=2932265 RepID=UPI002153508F|nr:hypothetical protein [Shinella sp. CPCC 101442]MCR6498401.1 hypothetical protein [Shinella sp. CPCC 101442]
MHKADIARLVEIAASLAAKEDRHLLVFLLRMALIENADTRAGNRTEVDGVEVAGDQP